jgi:hypothetical protein
MKQISAVDNLLSLSVYRAKLALGYFGNYAPKLQGSTTEPISSI